MQNHVENNFPDTFERRSDRPKVRHADRADDWNYLDDQLSDSQRWSTWPATEKLMRGPLPYPEFVIEDAGAIDTELGGPEDRQGS